jgi:mono/diheme cytochrome c family protein
VTARAAASLSLVPLVCLGLLGGCENAMRDMYDQPRYEPFAASKLWADGRASRPLEPGTVAHSAGTLAGTSSGRRNLTTYQEQTRATYTHSALQRGRERFTIYCLPCHGPGGDGNGYITQRGFPHPPTYHSDRLRDAPDSYLFGVISEGHGVMYSYADRVSPEDRWAIVAYIRALQLSQHATLDDVPDEERRQLLAVPTTGAH